MHSSFLNAMLDTANLFLVAERALANVYLNDMPSNAYRPKVKTAGYQKNQKAKRRAQKAGRKSNR